MTVLLSIFICSGVIADSWWSIDQPMESIPAKPLTGAIFGRNFILGSADINNHVLSIKSGDKLGVWPESELLIFVKIEDGKKEWVITPNSDGNVPHIHMKFAKKNKSFPGTLMFTEGYSMKLVFTEVTKTKATGLIHVSLPDYKKSYLVGSFTATRK